MISETRQFTYDPQPSHFSVQDFIFAFKVIHQNDSNFQYHIHQVQYRNHSQDINKGKTFMTPCTKEHFQSMNQKYFEQLLQIIDISQYHCPPINYTFILEGQQSSEIFKYLQVVIETCPTCTNQSLDQQLEIKTLISNYVVNPSSDQDTIAYLYNDLVLYQTQMPNMYSVVDIQLEKAIIREDNSIIPFYQNITTNELYTVVSNNIREYNVYKDIEEQKIISKFNLRLSQKSQTHDKHYKKIDELLSYFGGLLKFILLIVGLVMKNYNRFGLYIEVANKLYNFNIPQTKVNGKLIFSYDLLSKKIKDQLKTAKEALKSFQRGASKILQINKLSLFKAKPRASLFGSLFGLRNEDQTQIFRESSQIMDKATFLNIIFEEILKCRTQVKMQFSYLLSLLTCKKCFYNTDIQLIDQAITMIKNDMDIIVLMDRLQEIDKLKRILLNNDQLYLFDFTPKPVIKIKTTRKNGKKSKVKLVKDDKKEEKSKTDRQQKREVIKKLTDNYPHLVHYRLKPQNKRQSIFSKKESYQNKQSLLKLQQAYEKLIHENVKNGKHDDQDKNGQLLLLLGKTFIEIFETAYLLDKRDTNQGKAHQPYQPYPYNYQSNQNCKIQLEQEESVNTQYVKNQSSPNHGRIISQASPDDQIPIFSSVEEIDQNQPIHNI